MSGPQRHSVAIRLSILLLALPPLLIAPARADTVHAAEDAYTQQDKPDENAGDSKEVEIKDDVEKARTGFVRFDLAATLPPGALASDIELATLRMFVTDVKSPGVVELRRVLDPWDEETITAGSSPMHVFQTSLFVAAADEDHFVTADVTSLVRDWVEGDLGALDNNFGIAFVAAQGAELNLGAKETQHDHEMQLEIVLKDEDGDSSNELNLAFELEGADLELTDAAGTLVADLSGLIDDADADPANELNDSLVLDAAAVLSVTDAGGPKTADLSGLEESAEIDADISAHAGVPDAHHAKTSSFSELSDTATDAQIPDDITIDYAATAGDADTVDGAEAAELEESAEIDADISAHAGVSDAHHAKTSSFSELSDTATDAQIPDDITIDYAVTAGDADTVDGAEAAELEESAEIDADISAHAGVSDAHHAKTSSFSELSDTATDAQIPDDITIDYAATAGDADTVDGMHASDLIGAATDNLAFPVENTRGGENALASNASGARNTAFGNDALQSNTTGSDNTAFGRDSLQANVGGSNNTAVGQDALKSNDVGTSNTAVGREALAANSDGTFNTAVGRLALGANTTGDNNTAVGVSALGANTTGSGNVAVGRTALISSTVGRSNVAVGIQAMRDNLTGDENVAIGEALLSSETGDRNVAVGDAALLRHESPFAMTAVGHSALRFHASGEFNTAVGSNALGRGTMGSYNTAVGDAALRDNEGDDNTALGLWALLNKEGGDRNVALGRSSLGDNLSGDDNVAVGFAALFPLRTGSGNNAFGTEAGAALNGSESNNLLLDNRGISGESDTIRIGDTQTKTFLAGVRGITTGEPDAVAVVIDSNGQLGTAPAPAGGGPGGDVSMIRIREHDGMLGKVVLWKTIQRQLGTDIDYQAATGTFTALADGVYALSVNANSNSGDMVNVSLNHPDTATCSQSDPDMLVSDAPNGLQGTASWTGWLDADDEIRVCMTAPGIVNALAWSFTMTKVR